MSLFAKMTDYTYFNAWVPYILVVGKRIRLPLNRISEKGRIGNRFSVVRVRKCGYCLQRNGYEYIYDEEKVVSCCAECFTTQKRMFEFFQNKRPLLKNLSNLDYLNETIRAEEFARECSILRKNLQYYICVLTHLLPLITKARMLILEFCTRKVCRENRITIDELIIGGEGVNVVR